MYMYAVYSCYMYTVYTDSYSLPASWIYPVFFNQLRLVKQGILPTYQVEQDNQVRQAHSGPPIQACRQGGQDYRIKLEIPESGSSLCGKFVIVVVVAYHNFPSGH